MTQQPLSLVRRDHAPGPHWSPLKTSQLLSAKVLPLRPKRNVKFFENFFAIFAKQIWQTTCFFLIVAAGSNSAHAGPSNAVKLDNETEELKHDRLDLSVGKVIQQARTAKGLTQIELARVSFFFFYLSNEMFLLWILTSFVVNCFKVDQWKEGSHQWVWKCQSHTEPSNYEQVTESTGSQIEWST